MVCFTTGATTTRTANLGSARAVRINGLYGVGLCEGDYKRNPSNDQYDLHVLANTPAPRYAPVLSIPGLDCSTRENGGNWLWDEPERQAIGGGSANPSIVCIRSRGVYEGTYDSTGPLEAVIPLPVGGFNYASDGHPQGWGVYSTVPGHRLQGASFIASYVGSGSPRDNPHGDKVVAGIAVDGTLQIYYRRANGSGVWEWPLSFGRHIMAGEMGNIFSGRPSIIMSDFNEYVPNDWINLEATHYRNYELIAPLKAGGIAHFWKDNGEVNGGIFNDRTKNEISQGWHGFQIFGEGIYQEVSMIQSNLGEGDNGHLEVVARRPDQSGFDFYWRDDDLVTWHGPSAVG